MGQASDYDVLIQNDSRVTIDRDKPRCRPEHYARLQDAIDLAIDLAIEAAIQIGQSASFDNSNGKIILTAWLHSSLMPLGVSKS